MHAFSLRISVGDKGREERSIPWLRWVCYVFVVLVVGWLRFKVDIAEVVSLEGDRSTAAAKWGVRSGV